MTKVIVRTGDVDGFFSRAKDAACQADQGLGFDGTVTLSFEDPQEMFAVLSESRRKLMAEILHEPRTINDLMQRLHRKRWAISQDISFLEKMGLSCRSGR